MAAFKIGISMAGAVSAGAYTAGVLDFLTEALDDWYEAKNRGEMVPQHDVSIEVITGASAGGMCAAISAVMLQEEFEHIHDATQAHELTTNRFYESWVNKINIDELLKTRDFGGKPLVSLLDSTIIENIADYALTPGKEPIHRQYVSPKLTLILSLTNLQGTPYSLNGRSIGSAEETTFYYGDKIRFQIVRSGEPTDDGAYPLDLSKQGVEGGWDVLKEAGMATGAVPIALAARILERSKKEYAEPVWGGGGSGPYPNFPIDLSERFSTLNVDGGMVNNDPFRYALDFLFGREAIRKKCDATESVGAVFSIAPFPTREAFKPINDGQSARGVFSVFAKLIPTLINQSRFYGESLSDFISGSSFDRFVIAPSDHELAEKSKAKPPEALQCASLGAFGGFLDRGFRAHDYALGRRNCQRFLKKSFVLPVDNVVIGAALKGMSDAERRAVIEKFKCAPPGDYTGEKKEGEEREEWLPVIPLCGNAAIEVPHVERHRMEKQSLDRVMDSFVKRFMAVTGAMIPMASKWWVRYFFQLGRFTIPYLIKGSVRAAVVKNLGDSYAGD